MEFNEKLQALRKQKNLTQEELAEALYVSRAAVAKWEQGRGYPGIDSLKAIAAFFSVTVDDLLSGGEVLTIAEAEHEQKEQHLRDMLFGLLDCGAAMLLFLPFFGQQADVGVSAVSLLSLGSVAPYVKTAALILVAGMILVGILTLALQGIRCAFWQRNKCAFSLVLHAVGSLLFIISLQPYAAAFLFVFLLIKMFVLLKRL